MPRLDDGQLTRCVQALNERERSVVVNLLRRPDSRGNGLLSRDLRGERSCDPASRAPTPAGLHGGDTVTSQYDHGDIDCSNPIDPVVLMDYWLATLPSGVEEDVEQHLMACDRCGDRLREVIVLAEGLRTLARSGSLQVVISNHLVERAAATGFHVREYAPAPGEAVQCTVSADDDLLVARLTLNVTAARRVDLSWCDPQGVERQRMVDIPVRADAGSVICQQSITWAKASPSSTMIARILAVNDGGERLLGEYTFHHTRTIPGPPGVESP
jgi:hypothetical protein